MARQGYKIFDADTHVGPAADIPARYLTALERASRAAAIPWAATSAVPAVGSGW